MDRNQFNEVYHNGFWVQDDLDMAKFRDAAPCGTALPKAQGTKSAEDAASAWVETVLCSNSVGDHVKNVSGPRQAQHPQTGGRWFAE